MTFLGVDLDAAIGRQSDGYEATGTPTAQLVIVLQVYDDPANQVAIAKIGALYTGSGLRLIGVESADRAIAATPGRTDIPSLLASEQVSAGVLSLLNSGRATIDVHGIDDLSLIPPSHAAMTAVSQARDIRERVYRAVRVLLTSAYGRHQKMNVALARATRYAVHGSRQPIRTQSLAAQEAAKEAGVSLAGFPQVTRFLGMIARERTLDNSAVASERETFLRQVIERVGSWHRHGGGNRISIDLKKAEPLLNYWLHETKQPVAAFEAAITGPNPEAPLLACKQWYDAWLARAARESARAGYWEDLMRFALLVDIPYFQLRSFREYVAHLRDAERLKVGLDDELEDLHRTIADVLSGPAGDIVRIEERLDVLYRLLELAVPPGHAAEDARRAGPVEAAVRELAELAGESLTPDLLRDLAALDPPRLAALDFLEYSRRRSRHMVESMLALLHARHEDRGMLVVGGFHAKAITTVLEDHPDVSWAVIMPAVDVEAGWREHRKRF